jgi:MYXO-CTERM domain-containing protein
MALSSVEILAERKDGETCTTDADCAHQHCVCSDASCAAKICCNRACTPSQLCGSTGADCLVAPQGTACEGDPGRACLPIDDPPFELRCRCVTNDGCGPAQICNNHHCQTGLEPDTSQISCALTDSSQGGGAALLSAVIALVLRRRRQKGKVAES